MKEQIKHFPDQLIEALELASKIKKTTTKEEIHNIHLVGLGGSGIGANFVSEFIRPHCKLPFSVSKGYSIPAFVGKNTLAIASSYSGNTEETLACLEQMIQSGAKVIGISSGGRMQELLEKNNCDFIPLPKGKPAPRACLGYSLVQQIGILVQWGFVPSTLLEEIHTSALMLKAEQDQICDRAHQIAGVLDTKLPVIYATRRMEPVAVRFRQQLNENSKMLAWHHVIPEMNHNELVGWRSNHNDKAVVFLRNRNDFPRNQKRIEIIKEVIGNFSSSLIDIYSRGNSLIQQSMYLVHLLDWVSVYIADNRGVDAMEIKVIDYLKSSLSDS